MSTRGSSTEAARRASTRYGLVHVESGTVLASSVTLGGTERRRWWPRLRAGVSPGEDEALVVTPATWAHTFFAPSPIDVIFVDRDGTILKARPAMKPWRVVRARHAHAVIQGPPGLMNRGDAQIGDRVALREELEPRDDEPPRLTAEEVPESLRTAAGQFASGAPPDGDAADPWDIGPGRGVAAPAPRAAGQPGAEAAAPAVARAPETDLQPAEASTPDLPKAPSRRAFSRGVDLARLLDGRVTLAWFEAVAIAQELFAVLLETGRAGRPVELALGDIAITPEGGVDVRGGERPPLPTVPQAAELLLSLLGAAQTVPVQLRLLALEEVSPTTTATSLLELTTRLAAFERPGRRDIIRDVYTRFTQLPARESEPAAKARPPARQTPPAGPAWWRSRTVQTAAASVALLVAAGLAAAWLWQVVVPLLSDRYGRETPGAGAAAAGDSMSAAAVERIRAAARRIWLGTGAQRAAPTAQAALDSRPAVVGSPAGLPLGPSPKPVASSPMPDAVEDARTVADRGVFSAADAGVVPPSLLRPRLPSSPRAGVRPEDLPLVELLVSPTGEVESVKLVTQSAGVKPSMMLSAIKNWRFEPAKRGGQPVRYRLTMRLTNQ